MTEPTCVVDHGRDAPPETLPGLRVCPRHRRRMDADTTEIAALIVDSTWIVEGGITGAPLDDGPRGKSPKKRADPPAPGDVTIMALFDPATAAARIKGTAVNPAGDQSDPIPNVLAVVSSWLLLVADERPLTGTVLPKSVLGQLAMLHRHHEWMAAQECIGDYLLELAELRKALASVVRDVRYERRGYCQLPVEGQDGPCRGTLLEENGTRHVRCTRCRARWVTAQELARLAISQETA